MISSYKGIDLSSNEYIKNYIVTYHILDRQDYLHYLDEDAGLQLLVKKYYIRQKILIMIFNFLACVLIIVPAYFVNWDTREDITQSVKYDINCLDYVTLTNQNDLKILTTLNKKIE